MRKTFWYARGIASNGCVIELSDETEFVIREMAARILELDSTITWDFIEEEW